MNTRSMFVEKYRVCDCIGHGHNYWIFKGLSVKNESVIIKFASDNRRDSNDVPKEIQMLYNIKMDEPFPYPGHVDKNPIPGICQMIEFFRLDHEYIIVMERKDNLVVLRDFEFKDRVKIRNIELAVEIIKDLLDTVSELYYRKGIVHGDLTLDNILICRHNHAVYLMNFGSAVQIDQKSKKSTLQYRPPEYFTNKALAYKKSTIVWNLGIICNDIRLFTI